MKKFIGVLVILAMVNVANAGLVDLVITSLNGEQIQPTKEITIKPSDIVDLQIWWTAPATDYLFALGAKFDVQGPGTLDTSAIVRNAAFDGTLEAKGPDFIVEAGSFLGPQGAVEPVVAVANLLLHCDDIGRVILSMGDYAGSPTLVVDEGFNLLPFEFGAPVIINQIPEPMTLTLLGLGGLFLARRKK